MTPRKASLAGLFIQNPNQKGEHMSSDSISPPARHFTVQTLARHWEVSPSHIYNLVHSNALRHLRIGTAIRIPIDFVKEFEEAACQISKRNIGFGNIQTEQSTLYGQSAPKPGLARSNGKQDAFQRGQQTGKMQNNSERNSSQD